MNKIYWIAGLFLLLLFFWGGTKYIAHQKVGQLVERANEKGNKLSVDRYSVSFNFFSLGLTADSIYIEQTTGNQRLTGKIGRVSLAGLSLASLLFKDYPRASLLVLNKPDLLLHPIQTSTEADSTSVQAAKKELIKFGEVQVIDGQFRRRTQADSEAGQNIYGLTVNGREVVIPPDLTALNKLKIKADSIHFCEPANPAEWWMRDVQITDQEGASIGKITLEPKQTQRTFLTRLETKKSWNALSVLGLTLTSFSLAELARDTIQTSIKEMKAQSFDFIVYERPALPRQANEQDKKMPVELLRDLPVNLIIDKIALPSVNLTYGVLDIDGKEHGLPFKNGSINLTNVSTVRQGRPLIARANFTFDRQAPIDLKFELDQSGNGRDFLLSGKMGAYDLVSINPLMRIAADAIVNSGTLQELSYAAEVKDEVARGDMMFKYEDLGLKITGEKSFFKNLFSGLAIKSHNPQKDGSLRHGKIYYEHDPKRPFFHFYWQAIVSGLKSTTVGNLFTTNELDSDKVRTDKE